MAKSLAKQIIGGIRTKDVTPYNNSDQYQKPKKPYKTLEEMSSSEIDKLYDSPSYLKLQAIRAQMEEIEHDIVMPHPPAAVHDKKN